MQLTQFPVRESLTGPRLEPFLQDGGHADSPLVELHEGASLHEPDQERLGSGTQELLAPAGVEAGQEGELEEGGLLLLVPVIQHVVPWKLVDGHPREVRRGGRRVTRQMHQSRHPSPGSVQQGVCGSGRLTDRHEVTSGGLEIPRQARGIQLEDHAG